MKRLIYILIAFVGLLSLNSCENRSNSPNNKGVLDGTTWEGIGFIGTEKNVFVFANNKVSWSCYTDVVDTKYTYDYEVQGPTVYIGHSVSSTHDFLMFRGTISADTTSIRMYYYGSDTEITVYRK